MKIFNRNKYSCLIKILGIFVLILLFGCNKSENFTQVKNIEEIEKGKVMVLVSHSTKCKTCDNFKENILKDLPSADYNNFLIMDVDKLKDDSKIRSFQEKYEVFSIPALLILDNGKLIKRYHALELQNNENTKKIIYDFIK